MHRVRMLLHFGITPYLVFDGDYLPSKAGTEVDRAKRREESKKKGLELYHNNKPSQAHLELQKAVEVTPTMARELIDELKKLDVQYVVAPYEADAQLIYLEKKGLIQGMLSEDSDLLVFGACRLLTKLDQYGDCTEIHRGDFTACREVSLVGWTDADFRRMAILSGCDYLPSITGMGLKKAYRMVRKYKSIDRILRMLQFDGKFHVPAGYLEAFEKAELTFLYQRVFCPLENRLVTMTMAEETSKIENLSFIGAPIDQETAISVARGDLDPVTKCLIRLRSRPPGLLESKNDKAAVGSGGFSSKEKEQENRTLNTFFRPKRTPLAELDPNSFKPSPRQETLLQQANRSSWEPSAVSSATSTPGRRINRPVDRQSASRSMIQTSNSETSIQCLAPKKRRFFGDVLGESSEVSLEAGDVIQSPFFEKAVSSNPNGFVSEKRPKNCRSSENAAVSDESNERIKPDIANAPVTSFKANRRQFSIFKDQTPNEAGPSFQGENATPEVSRASDSSGKIKTASTLAETCNNTLTGNPSGDRILKMDKSSETTASPFLKEDSVSTRDIDTITISSESSTLFVSNNPLPRETWPQNQRKTALTPLQRLRASALSRSRSFNDLYPRKEITKYDQIVRPMKTIQNDGRGSCANLTSHGSFGPDASAFKGSEDLLIDDSDEEHDERTGNDLRRQKSFPDLGSFAFAG